MPRTKKKAVPGKGFFDIVRNIVNPVKDVIGKIPGPVIDIAKQLAEKEIKKAVGLGKKRRRRVGKGFLSDLVGITGLGKKRRGRGTITSENRKVMIT